MARFESLGFDQALVLLRNGFSLDGLWVRRTVVHVDGFEAEGVNPIGDLFEVVNAAGAVLFVERVTVKRYTPVRDAVELRRAVFGALVLRLISYAQGCTVKAARGRFSWRVRSKAEVQAGGDACRDAWRGYLCWDDSEEMLSCESSWDEVTNGRSLPLALAEELL